jgi:transcriptional regulator with XRE-family HTH domain
LLNEELVGFLNRCCRERRLSFRRLSLNAGLSPGTVHNIVKGKHRPNVSSLNALSDYLGVKREYLWQMAGLLEDMDYSTGTTFGDPEVRFHFAQVDKLPRKKRALILSVIEALMVNLLAEESAIQIEDTIVSEIQEGHPRYDSKPAID